MITDHVSGCYVLPAFINACLIPLQVKQKHLYSSMGDSEYFIDTDSFIFSEFPQLSLWGLAVVTSMLAHM